MNTIGTTVQVAARSPDLHPGDPGWNEVMAELERQNAQVAERRRRAREIRRTGAFVAKATAGAARGTIGAANAIAEYDLGERVAPYDEKWNEQVEKLEATVRDELSKLRSQVNGDINAVWGAFQSAKEIRLHNIMLRKMWLYIAGVWLASQFFTPVIKGGISFVAPAVTGTVQAVQEGANWLDDRVEDLTGMTSLDRRIVAQAEKWVGQGWTRSRDAWASKIFRELGIDVKALEDLPPEGYLAEPRNPADIRPGDVVWFADAVGFVGRDSKLIGVRDGKVAEIPLADLGTPVLAIAVEEKEKPADAQATTSQATTSQAPTSQTWIDPLENMKQWRFTSGYGPRTHPVTGQKGKMHYGIDIAAPTGTPILSPADGTVAQVINDSTCGGGLVIDHPGGVQTVYCHASRVLVKLGQKVTQGQHVADVGNTGRSTGAHLHFGTKKNGKRVNPNTIKPDWTRW